MTHAVWGVLLTLMLGLTHCRGDPNLADSCPRCPPKTQQPTRILILGDRTGHPNDRIFETVLRDAKRLAPDLIISVGDLIQGYQPDDRISEANAEWVGVMDTFQTVFGPKIPLFATAGNHDIWSEKSETLFEETVGHAPNFSFELQDVRIILFDTSRFETESAITDDALNWLVRELYKARRYRSRIVVTHRPLWAINPGGKYGAPLHDVLIAGDVDYVITGHWHHAMSDERDGIQYRMIGPSGARPNRADHPETGNFQQFGWLVLDDGEVTLSLLDAGGVHGSDAFPYAVNQLEYKIEHRGVTARGFEIDPTSPAIRGKFEIGLTNVTKTSLHDAAFFSKGNWRMSPRRLPISLSPGQAIQLPVRFSRDPDAPLFPGPEFQISFPFLNGGTYKMKKALSPTLVRDIARCDAAPVVDGKLDDPGWQHAISLGGLHDVRGPSVPKSFVNMCYFNDLIYINATIEDGSDAARSARPRDTWIEDRDHFLVLFKPDIESSSYLKMVIDRRGTIYDRRLNIGADKINEQAFNDGAGAVQNSERGWTVEMALLLPQSIHSGERYGFNFAVSDVESAQMSIGWWQPLLEHNRHSFGILYFR